MLYLADKKSCGTRDVQLFCAASGKRGAID